MMTSRTPAPSAAPSFLEKRPRNARQEPTSVLLPGHRDLRQVARRVPGVLNGAAVAHRHLRQPIQRIVGIA